MVTTSGYQPRAGQGSIVASALWARRWVIAFAAVVAGLLGFQLSQLQNEIYQAETRIVLSATYPFDPLGGYNATNASRYLANQREIVRSRVIFDSAVTRLGSDIDVPTLAEAVDVSILSDSDIVLISARGPTAELAASRADAVATAYQDFVAAEVQRAADAAAQAVAADAAAVAGVRTEAAVYGDGIAVIERAVIPTAPVAPQPTRNALILAVVAALVASGFALWRRDRHPLEPEEAAGEAGVPLLGAVDVPARRGGAVPAAGEGALALATYDTAALSGYDMAMVALDYASAGQTGAVLVSDLGSGELAGDVVFRLAASAARTRRVLVVDADSRRDLIAAPAADGPPQRHGALEGTDLEPAVTEVQLDRPGGGVRVDVVNLLSGAQRPDPAEARQALTQLTRAYDLVLVHAGPLSSDPLSFALLQDVRTVVLVASSDRGSTANRDFAEVRHRLSLAGRECAGLVVAQRRKMRAPRRDEARVEAAAAPTPRETTVRAR